jgi:CDP-diacylglycerol--serine O-phosphatidyltransferase
MQINLRKAMFVLPNLFTVSSIFLGFYALVLCSGDATPVKLYQAALAIFFAMFFDAFDGRVARMTKTQSDLGFIGLFVAFAFAACGALRLARFNVLAMRGDKGSSLFFVGLPIPLAAGAIVAIVIAHYKAYGRATDPTELAPVAVVVGLLAFLMVSTVRYRTFKDAHVSPRSLAVMGFVAASGLAVGLATRASFVLVVYMAAYIAMGLAESLFINARKIPELARLSPAVRAELEADEALEPSDEEDEEKDKDERDEYI